MNNYSRETLRRIEQNDDALIEMGICNDCGCVTSDGRYFTSRDGEDYCRLGSCIGTNCKLKTLNVKLEGIELSITDSGFFEGIKQNSSINKVKLSGFSHSGGNIRIGEVGCELLKAFHENNSNLTSLQIWCCDISNAEESIVINTTLSRCTNLKTLNFNYSNMTDEQLFPIVEAVKRHRSIRVLKLEHNGIGNVGCQALAILLQDPNCNLHTLRLKNNEITNEGAIVLVNSLVNNTKLKDLIISDNQMDNQNIVEDAFSRVLCNTSNINAIYSSNHTLTEVFGHYSLVGCLLVSLQKLNKGINKKYVVIKKILKYHPNINMTQLFEWGSRDERNIMSLPYVIAWFERAGEAVEDIGRDDGYHYQVEEKKLTAIYQFALAMPLLFIPTSDKKRKRVS